MITYNHGIFLHFCWDIPNFIGWPWRMWWSPSHVTMAYHGQDASRAGAQNHHSAIHLDEMEGGDPTKTRGDHCCGSSCFGHGFSLVCCEILVVHCGLLGLLWLFFFFLFFDAVSWCDRESCCGSVVTTDLNVIPLSACECILSLQEKPKSVLLVAKQGRS